MNIEKILEKTSNTYTDKKAIAFQGEEVTFSDLRANTLKLANALKDLGITKGERIAFYLPNCPHYIYSYLSTFCLGAVGVPLDYMLKSDELVSCLDHSETKILIARSKEDVDLSEIKNQAPSLETIILIDEPQENTLSFHELLLKGSEENLNIDIQDSDPALIMYTSGTTGKPKGILLNYRHLEGSPKAMEHFVDLTDKDIKLCTIPLSHIAGFIYIQNCILFGITLILMARFNPFEFLKKIQEYKVTCFHIVPAMYTAILSLKQIEKFDLSSLRWVVVFGAPSSPDILERFHKYCPNAQLLNGWGMTETCPPNTVTPLGSDNIKSIGKPAPHCEIKIIGEEGQELPAGAIGEIVIKGWVVMDCYYKDPEATAELKRDGWLYTGDLGKYDEEGYLYIMGRKKEMIKVGGQIVYAPEIETAFYKNEEVSEAAVIGVADRLRGEAVKAFIVLKEESDLKAEDLRSFAREHLANFKVPQTIEIRDVLPKNRTGKIDKETLKQEQTLKEEGV